MTTATPSTDEIAGLIEPGRVHRRVYTDPDVFALEQARIFGRLWIYVGHASRIPEPGDFLLSRIGVREILVVRQADGAIAALHNRCAHRGAQVCAAAHGHARSFVCPYHGWAYRLDGSLIGVPMPEGYGQGFAGQRVDWHLPRVPRVEAYRGFVFASLAASGPSLVEYLGGMAGALDNMVDRAPGGALAQHPAHFKQVYRGNWKFHMENATDTIHTTFVHASSAAAGRAYAPPGNQEPPQEVQMFRANGISFADWDKVGVHAYPRGHAFMGGFYRGGAIAPERSDPVFDDYRSRLVARHGEAKTVEILAVDRFNNLIYPNLSINTRFQQLRVIQPIAPDLTEVHSYCFHLKGAPPEMIRLAMRFVAAANSPASLISSDDFEIFERTQAGLARSDDPWVDFSRGLGAERPSDTDEATRSPGTAEAAMRGQYQAWLAAMTTP
jgi:phenylpropionate dioxygenase-like ring-hydroxylating dioxygenase large terminal subunit